MKRRHKPIGRVPAVGKPVQADNPRPERPFVYDPNDPAVQRLEKVVGKERLLELERADREQSTDNEE